MNSLVDYKDIAYININNESYKIHINIAEKVPLFKHVINCDVENNILININDNIVNMFIDYLYNSQYQDYPIVKADNLDDALELLRMLEDFGVKLPYYISVNNLDDFTEYEKFFYSILNLKDEHTRLLFASNYRSIETEKELLDLLRLLFNPSLNLDNETKLYLFCFLVSYSFENKYKNDVDISQDILDILGFNCIYNINWDLTEDILTYSFFGNEDDQIVENYSYYANDFMNKETEYILGYEISKYNFRMMLGLYIFISRKINQKSLL